MRTMNRKLINSSDIIKTFPKYLPISMLVAERDFMNRRFQETTQTISGIGERRDLRNLSRARIGNQVMKHVDKIY